METFLTLCFVAIVTFAGNLIAASIQDIIEYKKSINKTNLNPLTK